MPYGFGFGYDLSQVFNMLMQKTMYDFKFGNMGGFGNIGSFGNMGGFSGFSGMSGFNANSCWGGGFPAAGTGDMWNFNNTPLTPSTPSTPSLTDEEKAEKEVEVEIETEKFNQIKQELKDYKDTKLSDKEKGHRVLANRIDKIDKSSYSEENATKAKELYNEIKTKSNSEYATTKKKMDGLAAKGKGYVKKLSAKQLEQLNNLSSLGIEEAWVDAQSNYSTQKFIRVIDLSGNLHCINGVTLDDNGNVVEFKEETASSTADKPIFKTGAAKTIERGGSITPEQIEKQAKASKAIANSALKYLDPNEYEGLPTDAALGRRYYSYRDESTKTNYIYTITGDGGVIRLKVNWGDGGKTIKGVYNNDGTSIIFDSKSLEGAETVGLDKLPKKTK